MYEKILSRLILNLPLDSVEIRTYVENGRQQKRILAFADLNGLYYATALRIKELGISLVDPERWQVELERVSEIVRTIEVLNSISTERGFEYIVIKDYKSIPNVARDVDILIHDDDRALLAEELKARGYSVLYDNPAETSFVARGFKRIDTYTRIQYFGKELINSSLLWNEIEPCRTHEIIHPALSVRMSFLVNSIHGLFGHPSMTLLDFLYFAQHIKDPNIVSTCERIAKESGWLELLEKWFQRIHYLENKLNSQNESIGFPTRNGIFYTMHCLSMIDGLQMSSMHRLNIIFNLLWDDLIYALGRTGIASAFESSRILSGLANQVGHKLRQLRGDEK